MKIRSADLADVAAISRIVTDAYAQYIERMGKAPGPMLDDYKVRVAMRSVWVAENVGELVGLIVLLPQKDHVLLDNVAVAPAHQRRGVGHRLMSFAEEEVTRQGYGELRLYTHVTMTENIAMYSALGWQETGRGEQAGYQRVFFRKQLEARR